MKKIIALHVLLLILSVAAAPSTAQSKKKKSEKPLIGLGLKGGLNFANVTRASSVNASNKTGFVVGAFLAPPSKSIISSRTELLFSRQGYDFKSGTNTGSVNLSYLILPQLMGINITKYVQLQIGAQMAYLLNAKADSTAPSTGNPQVDKIMDLYNRFDYGAAGGIEIYPIKNLLIGARINISFGKLYKEPSETQPGSQPNFFPSVDAKNNVVQLFLGFRF
jgi:hypothetical protein